MSDPIPSHTIYVNNLNEKIKKEELKKSLHAIFSQFGKIVDIVALRRVNMRGQAWVVFDEVAAATTALQRMQGFPFYDKPLRIAFAKEKSDAIAKRDGTYVKRKPSEKKVSDTPKAAAPAEHAASSAPADAPRPPPVSQQNTPHRILFAQELPDETNENMLRMLFQQYRGFKEVRLVEGKGVAFVEFEEEMAASMAMQGLSGFKLSPTHTLRLSYANK